ncbi:unnamed protein product [Candida parapsilosis]
MKDIGHKGPTLHSNDNIDDLIEELPESCECLWFDTYKDCENTEINMYNHYVSKELPGHLVQNKDVSTCRKMFGKSKDGIGARKE